MNNKFMELAIKEAIKANKKGEVPVGAVLVKNDKVIAKSYNKIESKNDCTFHAEINVIKKASKKLKNWRLMDCDLYVTLEPCEMCYGAIKHSRIKNVYFAVPKNNKKNNKINIVNMKNYNNEYIKLLQNFFKEKRG